MASSGQVCISCGDWVEYGTLHSCPSSYTATVPEKSLGDILGGTRRIPMGGPVSIAKRKDIEWQEYTPARPPESGDYIVITLNTDTGSIEWIFSTFDKPKLDWVDTKWSDGAIVTHYARIELP